MSKMLLAGGADAGAGAGSGFGSGSGAGVVRFIPFKIASRW